MTTARIQSTPLMHSSFFRRFVPDITVGSFKATRADKDTAARLHFLAQSFPTMPAGLALAWATGKATVKQDGDVLVVSYDELADEASSDNMEADS